MCLARRNALQHIAQAANRSRRDITPKERAGERDRSESDRGESRCGMNREAWRKAECAEEDAEELMYDHRE